MQSISPRDENYLQNCIITDYSDYMEHNDPKTNKSNFDFSNISSEIILPLTTSKQSKHLCVSFVATKNWCNNRLFKIQIVLVSYDTVQCCLLITIDHNIKVFCLVFGFCRVLFSMEFEKKKQVISTSLTSPMLIKFYIVCVCGLQQFNNLKSYRC